jgi:hypothetical protein
MLFWNWYVATTFRIGRLSMHEAFGLYILMNLLAFRPAHKVLSDQMTAVAMLEYSLEGLAVMWFGVFLMHIAGY